MCLEKSVKPEDQSVLRQTGMISVMGYILYCRAIWFLCVAQQILQHHTILNTNTIYTERAGTHAFLVGFQNGRVNLQAAPECVIQFTCQVWSYFIGCALRQVAVLGRWR